MGKHSNNQTRATVQDTVKFSNSYGSSVLCCEDICHIREQCITNFSILPTAHVPMPRLLSLRLESTMTKSEKHKGSYSRLQPSL